VAYPFFGVTTEIASRNRLLPIFAFMPGLFSSENYSAVHYAFVSGLFAQELCS
jgi:hypothetical protein